MLEEMIGWNFAEVVLEIFVGVFGSPFGVGVLLFGGIDETHVVDMLGDLAIGEEAAEVGVLEGVVVGEGNFVDMIGGDEWFLWLLEMLVVPSH